MAFNKYPYTDFHELNADYLLSEMKRLASEWESLGGEFKSLKEAFESLKAYVMDYFKNLDVSDEISKKLDEMYEEGLFDSLIGKFSNFYDVAQLYPAFQAINRADVAHDVALGELHSQAICYADSPNGHFLYVGFDHKSGSANHNQIVKYSLDTNEYIAHNTDIKETIHYNGMDYCAKDNCVYVPVEASNVIMVLDSSLNHVRDITAAVESPHCLAYNPDKDVFYVIYSGNTRRIYEYSYDFELIGTHDYSFENMTIQDISYHSGCIFVSLFKTDNEFLYAPSNEILVLNTSFISVKKINIPMNLELEACVYSTLHKAWLVSFYTNSKAYICLGSLSADNPNMLTEYAKVFGSSGSATTRKIFDIYVDENYTGFKMDYSQEYPCSALVWVNPVLKNNASNYRINLLSDVGYTHNRFYNTNAECDSVIINGNNHTVQGLYFRDIPYINISNVKFDGGNSVDTGNCVSFYNCGYADLSGCEFSVGTSHPATIGIDAEFTKCVKVSNCVDNGGFDAYVYCKESDARFANGTYSSPINIYGMLETNTIEPLRHVAGYGKTTLNGSYQFTEGYNGSLSELGFTGSIAINGCNSPDLPVLGPQNIILTVDRLAGPKMVKQTVTNKSHDWEYERVIYPESGEAGVGYWTLKYLSSNDTELKIYISSDGNDSNHGLSSSMAMRSIKSVISKYPIGKLRIYYTSGIIEDDWNEMYDDRFIIIRSASSSDPATVMLTGSVSLSGLDIEIRDLNISRNDDNNILYIGHCSNVKILNSNITGSKGIRCVFSDMYLYNTNITITGQSTCLSVENTSNIKIHTGSLTSPNRGLYATGTSNIDYYSLTIDAPTPSATSSGGVITNRS